MSDTVLSQPSLKHYFKPVSALESSSLISLLNPSLMIVPSSVSSSSNLSIQPHSFDDPFDNPDMEPLPLGPGIASDNSGMHHHASPSMTPMKVPSLQPHQNLQVNGMHNSRAKTTLIAGHHSVPISLLSSILDPVTALAAGSKRSFESPSQQQHAEDPMESIVQKRQKLHHQYEASSDEECVARFRPYQENQWRIQFKKLIQFKLRTGHCCVPHSFPEDQVLARWVKRQRYQYKKLNDNNPTSTMTSRRIEELESIGFVWHSHHAAWLEKLNELKVFKEKRGHCNVPSHYPENVQLSTWVKCQRRQYKLYVSGKSSNMTAQRFEALEKLGFVFDVLRNKKVANNNKTSTC